MSVVLLLLSSLLTNALLTTDVVTSCQASITDTPVVVESWMESRAEGLAGTPTKTISVTSVASVVPDDRIDDRAGIQELIDASPAGTNIVFPAGTYYLASPLQFRSNQYYTGPGTLRRPNSSVKPLVDVSGQSNVVIRNLTFHGGGMRFSGINSHIKILNNRFTNINDATASYGTESGIFITNIFTDSYIVGNRFHGIGYVNGAARTKHGSGIVSYHLQRTKIAANKFTNVHQGISTILEKVPGTGDDLIYSENVVNNALRMGMEYWGKGSRNAIFENNCVKMGRHGDQDIALSIVADGSYTRVRNNLAMQTQPITSACAGMGIEIAGVSLLTDGNTILGNWCSGINGYNESGWSYEITNNFICGANGDYPAIGMRGGFNSTTMSGNTIAKTCPPSPPQLRLLLDLTALPIPTSTEANPQH